MNEVLYRILAIFRLETQTPPTLRTSYLVGETIKKTIYDNSVYIVTKISIECCGNTGREKVPH